MKHLIDLLLTDSNNNTETFRKIQNHLLNEIIDKNIINENYLKKLVESVHIQENCFEIIFSFLWNLFKKEEFQKRVVDLMYKFFQIDKSKFIQLFLNTFNCKEPRKQEKAIQYFTQFWKYYIENYQNEIFFENGECIFLMLNYIDSEYPLLRHLSKNWLNQSTFHFQKILDPIILLFLNKDIDYIEQGNHLFIQKEYNTKSIIQAFRYIKNLVLNVSVSHFITEKPKKEIIEKLNINEKKELSQNMNYFNLLILITTRFINFEFVEGINEELIEENISVSSSACEFLEILIKKTKDQNLIKGIFKLFLNKIFIILANKLGIEEEGNLCSINVKKNDIKEDKRNQVLQIQLLEIMKLLMFEKADNSDLIEIYSSELLLQCLAKGITLNYFYVRRHYILFVERYLSLMIKIFKQSKIDKTELDNTLLMISKQLISNTTKFIIDKVKFNENLITVNSEINQIFIFKNYLDEYKDYKTFDENDLDILLKGLNSIVRNFLDFDKIKGEQNDMIKKKLKDISNSKKPNYYDLFTINPEKDKSDNNLIYESNIHDLISICLICWINESENYETFDYCLNNNSILCYKEAKNEKPNQNYVSYVKNWKGTIKEIMQTLIRNLFLKNPIIFLQNYLDIWNGDCTYDEKTEKPIYPQITPVKDKLYKLTMLELLYSLDIDLDLILLSISVIYNNKYPPKKSKYIKGENKIYITPYDEALYESQICHFIYSFILLDPRVQRKKIGQVSENWKEFVNFVNNLYERTKISHTLCWLYELISLMFEIYPKKNLNFDISGIEDIADNITEKLSNIAFKNQFESTFQKVENYIILPIVPSLYTEIVKNIFPKDDFYKITKSSFRQMKQNINEDYLRITTKNYDENFIETSKDDTNKKSIYYNNDNEESGDFLFYKIYMKICLLASSYENIEKRNKIYPDDLQLNYRNISLLTLKFLFFKIYKSIGKDLYSPFKSMLKQILNNITNPEKFISEVSIQFLNKLIHENSEKVCQVSGSNILEFFLKDTFFQTSFVKLRNWRKIIAKYSEENKDIINNLIKNLEGGLFSKNENNYKVKILRRICFVIYSSKVDAFSKNLNVIKDKIKEFFTEYNSREIEKELFLMLRILFIRFSHENILEMIRQLWPIIFNEIVKNLENKVTDKNTLDEFKLETFKFIELLSLKNIEEFSLYQWIFIIDTFDLERLNFQKKDSLLQIILNQPLIFRPFSIDCCLFWNDCENYMISNKKAKSKLVINIDYNNKKDMLEGLDGKIKKFFFSIGDMNNYKGDVDENNIEEVIEKDFIEKIDNPKTKK